MVDIPLVGHLGNKTFCCQVALQVVSAFLSNMKHILVKCVAEDKHCALLELMNTRDFRTNFWHTTSGS